ncbi:MAG: YdeI/OmpD-associated family protein [Gelidibacter sp.]
MMKSIVFSVGLLDQYHLQIPSEIAEPFAKNNQSRVKVKASFNGNLIEFHAALNRNKNNDSYYIIFSKRYQKELNVFQNDYFELQLFEDTSKYGVEIPEELEAVLLSDYEAYTIFESFTSGKQRSIIYTIIRIKNTQSRIDKALTMCDNLKRGITNPMEMFKAN